MWRNGRRNGLKIAVLDEKNIGDFQLDLFFNLGGHLVKLSENKAIDNCAFA